MNNSFCFILSFTEKVTDDYKNKVLRKILNYYGFQTLIENDHGILLVLKSHENILKTIYKFISELQEHGNCVSETKYFPMGEITTFKFYNDQ